MNVGLVGVGPESCLVSEEGGLAGCFLLGEFSIGASMEGEAGGRIREEL